MVSCVFLGQFGDVTAIYGIGRLEETVGPRIDLHSVVQHMLHYFLPILTIGGFRI